MFSRLTYEKNGSKTNIRGNIKCTAFHLLLFNREESTSEKLIEVVRKYVKAVTIEVIPFLKETEILYQTLGMQSGGWYLIRPDFYIAACSSRLEPEKLDTYLCQILISKI